MGHKKKNTAPRSKQSPPAAAVEAEPCAIPDAPFNQTKTEPSEADVVLGGGSSTYAAIKLECDRALTALRRGNHTKALRLMKELSSRHENSAYVALIHRVQGTVCVKVASIIDDLNSKQRHLKNAVESAKKAVELSPNSVEFAHFYANLLYEAANDGKEYEEVVQECGRALAIENPIDPAKESLQDESQQKILTAEARIAHVQSELRSLIQRSNIASISTWMKNLGTGEEKFRLIPIRRVAEDPMEVRLVQARRPNEIKKATKTPEERRKEIEVRVAAARLLQQKSETGQLQQNNEGEMNVDLGSGGLEKRERERRKHGSNLRRNRSKEERRDFVQSYWNSMSLEMKRELLRVKVCDIKDHFGSLKDGLPSDVLAEVLAFAEDNKTWRFWVCCRCNDKFADSESHMHHVVQEHMGNLLPKMQAVLPQSVDNEWNEMIDNCSWKPLDIVAAVKMLGRDKTKLQDSEVGEDFYSGNHIEERDDCFKDAWDSSPEKENLGDSYNCSSVEGNDCEKFVNIQCRECDGNQVSAVYPVIDNWPVADDTERAKLLERIHALFDLLLRHKCLSASHLSKVVQYTMDELQSLASGSQLLNHGVDQTPICMCFLGVHQLRKIFKFLQELSHACNLGRYSEKSNSINDANSVSQDLEIKENIVLNGDASCLLLDERLLPTELISRNAVMDNGTSVNIRNENGSAADADADAYALLSWIFEGPSSGEHLTSWMRTKEEKTHQGMEILQTLEKEFYHLQSLCERKCEHLSYEEALQAVEDLCLQEGKKRETVAEFGYRTYESVLRKRREEILEGENDITFISSRFESDAISNVLKEAEALNVNQFGYEDTYSGMTSQLCDLESGEDDDWRTKDYLHQVDTCVEVAIQRQKEQLSVELSKIDARIMRNVSGMQQLELKLKPVSAYDYRSILLPLLQSYLRAHLEDLAEKDATQKSDAAREAFLAELALDFKKGARGGSDSLKQTHDKTKDKRKHKEYRKTKDSKAVGGNERHIVHDETADLVSFPVESDGDNPDSETVVSANGDDLKLQEEEFRRKIELEAEERKLEETLEYQRQMENEAKLKHLAVQSKNSAEIFGENVAEGAHDVYLGYGTDDLDKNESIKLSTPVQSVLKDGFPNNFEGTPVNAANGAAVPIRSSPTSSFQNIDTVHHTSIKQGLPNGGTPEDGFLPTDRRTGRRGRRRRSSTISQDGKNQALSSEKENIEVRSNDSLLTGASAPYLEDSGTKTLRQLHAEEDDEERFQADLKQAVRQSLDTFQSHKKIPPVSSLRMPQKVPLEANKVGVSSNEVSSENVNGIDVYGTGLKNEVGEYNCFLNVIIQSLWHLRHFREEFLRRSLSEHIQVTKIQFRMKASEKETMEKKENGTVELEKIHDNGTMELEKAKKDEGSDHHDEPKINYRGWKAMPFIIGNETFEKLGAIGTLANLLIYLTSVFNMKSITAATLIQIFNGTTNFGTMIGAYLCDTYFGRYKTLGFATVASFLGLQLIQLTAAIPSMHPPHCAAESSTCKGPTGGQMAFLLSGFGLMIIGAGGVRPCNLAFGADQFNPKTESGKKGINSFFNWYFFTFTFGQMVSLTFIVHVQSNVSWAIGLAIPALLMLIACVLFFMGSKIYVKVPATGSPMISVAQVIVVAIKKRQLKQPDQPLLSLFNYISAGSINSKLPYTDQFRFFDKAAIVTPEDQINPDGSAANPWRLCSVQQIEEVKCILRVIPIWAAALVFHLIITQQNTYAVFQAQQSNRRLGNTSFKIPAASYVVFLMLSMTIWIPIYDRFFVPLLQRLTGKEGGITLLQRMGIGIGIAVITMLVSGFVEERRRTIALTKPTVGFQPRRGEISSMSGMFLIPQLALAGLSEAFTSIGQVEFYYKQFPENMRSIGGSLFFCGMGASSYLSSLLITIVHQTTKRAATGNWLSEDLNKGRLDYFYYIIAGLEILNLGYFLVCARWYKYKETGSDTAIEANGEAKQSDKTLA